MVFSAIVGDCGAGYLRVVPSAPCGMYIFCVHAVPPSQDRYVFSFSIRGDLQPFTFF